MSLLPELSALALRPFLSSIVQQGAAVAGDITKQRITDAPSAALQVMTTFLVSRFTDPTRKLPDALARAADRAWRSLEVALAGESLWTRLRDRGEDKAFRQQVRLFLDARTLEVPDPDPAFRHRCLEQLRAARHAGLVPGSHDPQATAQRSADFARFADPTQACAAEWQAAERMAGRLREARHADLAELLELRPPSQETPLLALAVRFFFRREIEQDGTLLPGLVYAQVDQVGEVVRAGFERLDAAFSTLGPALEQHGESLEQILPQLSALRGDVLDLKGEMERQGAGQQALYREVIRLGEKLDDLHERPLRPTDSQSIHSEAEQQLVKHLLARYRALPEEQRRQQPALLEAVGRLEMAAGDFPAARSDFRQVSQLVTDSGAKAAAHYGAYLAALEDRDWAAALSEVREAWRLDSVRYALFPQDRYEPEQVLGAGGFGVVFRCRHRYSKAPLVIKALRGEDLDRDLRTLFEEASVLEQLAHPAVIRLRDCGYADAVQSRPYLVMDYFDGLTLEEHVKRHGRLLEADALAVGRLMAEGLRAVHERHLLHRDVKPANVLVRRGADGWQVKLIDFGLAVPRRVVAHTVSNADALARTIRGRSIAGSVDYAAPEQMGRLPGVEMGGFSDVYGFGRTLCFALFGTAHPGLRH